MRLPIGTYLDDTTRLLTKGKLPRNDEPPDNTVDWQDVLEHPTDDHESHPTELTEQELVEDDNLLSAKVIFPRGDGSQHIGKVIEQK